jgi:hypothetical protein
MEMPQKLSEVFFALGELFEEIEQLDAELESSFHLNGGESGRDHYCFHQIVANLGEANKLFRRAIAMAVGTGFEVACSNPGALLKASRETEGWVAVDYLALVRELLPYAMDEFEYDETNRTS